MTAFQPGPGYAGPARPGARELYDRLSAGSRPAEVPAPSLRLQFGESCVGGAPVTVLQWAAGDGTYVHKSGGYWGGGLVGLAALRGAKAIGNSRRRKRAEREAEVQWRERDRGQMFLTNRRIVVQGAEGADLWFPYLEELSCDPAGLHLRIQGTDPLRLQVPDPDYWFVMVNYLAYRRLVFPASSFAG